MLSTTDLHVTLSGTPVLRGISLGFAPGRFSALMGANGSGKTTLLKALLGFVPCGSGEVTLDGVPLASFGRRALAHRIAYLPQENSCPDYMTLGEMIELAGYARYGLFGGPREADRTLFRQALETVGLSGMAHRRVASLSGGQRQRAWIAMILAQDTEIVVMDEPVNHLDMKYQYAVLDLVRGLVRRQGKTVIMVLHDLNLALSYAEDIALLRQGRLYGAGPVGQIVTPEAISGVFGIEAEIFSRNGRRILVPMTAGGTL